jgi:hypothetical protein
MKSDARSSFAVLLLFALVGCTRHYAGRVIDAHGRPVAYARVEGSPNAWRNDYWRRPVHKVRVVADLDGKFTLITSEWPGTITASSLIRNGMGAVDLVVSQPPIVIVVR